MAETLEARTVEIAGHGGDLIEAYLARPLDDGPHGGVVVIHHLPGYDAGNREITRRIAAHGYLALCPNLYSRISSDPQQAAAEVRRRGGLPDGHVVGDVAGAVSFLRSQPTSNAKVATIGYCSGGRHSLLSACRIDLDAAVDCYGGFVVAAPAEELGLSMGPILHEVAALSCPLLGLFGADDQNPSPEQTAILAGALEEAGKHFEFHTFEQAGHAFFAVDRPLYRPEAATKGWGIVFEFFGRMIA